MPCDHLLLCKTTVRKEPLQHNTFCNFAGLISLVFYSPPTNGGKADMARTHSNVCF
jgi:hypothetical protein